MGLLRGGCTKVTMFEGRLETMGASEAFANA